MDDDFNLLDLLMNAPDEVVQAHNLVDSEREQYVEEPIEQSWWNVSPFTTRRDSYTVY